MSCVGRETCRNALRLLNLDFVTVPRWYGAFIISGSLSDYQRFLRKLTMQTAIAPPQLTYWQWQGHDIHYVHAEGSSPSGPPLLLVHGFGASTDHWRKNIADLKQDFDVWAIDLLGFGRSAKPDIAYSADLWRDQLHDFITQVIGRPAILAGNSLGGYASLCVAAQRAQSATGLILLNSAGPFSDARKDQSTSNAKRGWRSLVQKVVLHPFTSFFIFQYTRRRSVIRQTLKKVYLDHTAVTDQLVEDIHRPSRDPGAAKVFAAVFQAKKGESVDVLLEQLTCPLLLVWGEGDPWMNTRERGERFRRHYPSLSEHYLQAGHCPHDEVPQQVNAIVRQWIAERVVEHGADG